MPGITVDQAFLNNNFWAAIIGASVSGLIALGIQLLVLKQAKDERAATEKARRAVVAKGLLFKTVRIHSDLMALAKHVSDGVAAGLQQRPPITGWAAVRPLSGEMEPVHYTADELAMASELGDDQLLQDVLELDWRHGTVLSIVTTYSRRRMELEDLVGGRVEGGVLHVEMNDEEYRFAAPRAAGLNQMIREMETYNAEDAARAGRALRKLSMLLREKVGITLRVNFPN